jgi:hypothetical protein
MMKKLALAAATLALSAFAGTASAQRQWNVVNNVAVIEAELADAITDGFQFESSTSGFKGSGYIIYKGGTRGGIVLGSQPSGSNPVKYRINITEAGTYTMELRSRKDNGAPDQSNDVFVKRANGNYIKHFLPGASSASQGKWLLDSLSESAPGVFFTETYNLQPGVFELGIAGRSQNYKIDRIYFYKGNVSNSTLEGLNDTSGPVITPGRTNFRNGNAGGAVTHTVPGIFAEPYFVQSSTGLMIFANDRANNNAGGKGVVFGGWTKEISDVVVNSGETYRAEFHVTSVATAANRNRVPTFRLRIADPNLSHMATTVVESNGAAMNSPIAGETKIYTIVYTVPPGISNGRLNASFDYQLVTSSNDDPFISIQLSEFALVRQ